MVVAAPTLMEGPTEISNSNVLLFANAAAKSRCQAITGDYIECHCRHYRDPCRRCSLVLASREFNDVQLASNIEIVHTGK
jgi:hypothetical protein